MPRYAVYLFRPTEESRTVIVEAEDEDDAKDQALSGAFDEDLYDDWSLGNPGKIEVSDIKEADPDEPLTLETAVCPECGGSPKDDTDPHEDWCSQKKGD